MPASLYSEDLSGVLSSCDLESGYVSGRSSQGSNSLDIHFTNSHLVFLNRQLQHLDPQGILQWCITTLPSLFQTTSFGLTGLVIRDMLSKMMIPRPQMVDIIFFDTLHHFPETLALLDEVRLRYSLANFHIYKPERVDSVEDFARKHGDKLWETNGDLYDWIAKVEPAQRAYRELQVNAVITGRRRSQGGRRGDLPVIEVDDAGLIKINPLASWTFSQVREYIKANNVPYNKLLDRGYKSIGDWHSTKPVSETEDERSGRWQGQQKTECGIHNPRSKFAQYLRDQELQRQVEVRIQPHIVVTS